MDQRHLFKTSTFLSLVLRHHPERIGVTLDEQGWTSIDELLQAMRRRGRRLTEEELLEVVRTNDKQRFALSEDGTRIRASQGHSVTVELGYEPKTPPDELYHGTTDRFLSSIQAEGLVRGTRHHVHLSGDRTTAMKVGGRRGKPVILVVQAEPMVRHGHTFYRSANGVWLTKHVPPEYIGFPG